jgi:O-antigen ligase
MFQDRPLNGVGFGQYNKYKKPYHQVENHSLPLQMALPYVQHNVMLSYLTELGLVGLLAAAAMWLGSIRLGLQAWAASASTLESRCLGLLLLTAVINYIMNGLFHDVSIIPVANSSLLFAAALLNPSEFSARSKSTIVFPVHDSKVLLANHENLLTRPF